MRAGVLGANDGLISTSSLMVEVASADSTRATVSGISFSLGAIVPIVIMAAASSSLRIALTTVATLVALVGLGAAGPRLGGAPQRRAAVRVFVGGSLALLISWSIGRLTGSAL